MSAWVEHVDRWKDCTDCPLCEQRDKICLARGKVPADVLFCGEAPGVSENVVGAPFVGPAGKLLDQIIERSVPSYVRYALTNLVACFPRDAKGRGDNEPDHYEIEACQDRLRDFITITQPKIVVWVGALAASYGPFALSPYECKTMSIIHPAAILRMPLAQQSMAAQKCIIMVRAVVMDMVESTKRGKDAGVSYHPDHGPLPF